MKKKRKRKKKDQKKKKKKKSDKKIDNKRGSGIVERPRNAQCQLKSCQCCTDNANRSRVSRRSTSPVIVLYTYRDKRRNHGTISMRCSVSHSCNTDAIMASSKTFGRPSFVYDIDGSP